jgi:hypothetical protein
MLKARNIVVYILCGLIIAGILSAIILSFKNKNNASPPIPRTNHSQSVPSVPKTSSNSSSNANNSSDSTNPALTNTGPGNTIGLFIVSSLFFTIIYWRVQVKRL